MSFGRRVTNPIGFMRQHCGILCRLHVVSVGCSKDVADFLLPKVTEPYPSIDGVRPLYGDGLSSPYYRPF